MTAASLYPGSDQETRERSKGDFYEALILTLLFLVVIWSVKVYEEMRHISLAEWGMIPGDERGLLGILTMPLLHADFEHLYANSFGLFVTCILLRTNFVRVSFAVFTIVWISCGTLVWFFARPSIHIGASGLVYGFASFLFFAGMIRRDRRSLGAALVTAFLFGGAIWGLIPLQRGISWEGHLFGAIVGMILAFAFRNIDRPESSWDDEDSEPPEKKPPELHEVDWEQATKNLWQQPPPFGTEQPPPGRRRATD